MVVVPILLGRGVRLWDGLEGLEKGHRVEAISSRVASRTSRSPARPPDRESPTSLPR
ncbi:hypothetical protein [Pseudonocardia humida]|uniref:hypothetical protein n=1 Tax=Pseudonocardia humida TaxID=2800819 RepID=UPI0027E26005|nr:hypothetical protein [Pseudonocardia humida]